MWGRGIAHCYRRRVGGLVRAGLDLKFGLSCTHGPAATSTLDVVWVLYDRVLRVSAEGAGAPERDRFLLSKGHGPMAYYAVLAAKGFFPESLLAGFGAYDSPLGNHPDRVLVPGGRDQQWVARAWVAVGRGECARVAGAGALRGRGVGAHRGRRAGRGQQSRGDRVRRGRGAGAAACGRCGQRLRQSWAARGHRRALRGSRTRPGRIPTG